MKHICVFGGSGFIGKCLVKQLINTGRKITVIGRNPVSPFDSTVNYASRGNRKNLNLLKEIGFIDEVIDLSYSSTPKTSFENPIRDIEDNLEMTVEVFQQLIDMEINKLIYVSSGGTVYGEAMELPVRENHITNPVSPYGITKLAIEKYGLMYHLSHNLPITIVRPGNAYGAGQIPFRGQGFIATAIATIIEKKKVKVFGNPGTIRDYIHVDDIACGIISALEHGIIGECYNIGTGIGKTNLDILNTLEPLVAQFGLTCEYEILPERLFDVKNNILDSSKLTEISGWIPKIDLVSGISEAVKWQMSLV